MTTAIVLLLAGALLFAAYMVAARMFGFVHRRLGVPAVVVLAAAILAAPVLAWKRQEYRYALSFVPPGLGVDTIVFEAYVSMGFGPGGNFQGVRLFELPDSTARRIEREGLAFLDAMEAGPLVPDERTVYSDWAPTPAGGQALPLPEALCVYDECEAVPADVRQRVNAIIAQPGSFVADGREGRILIVSPAQRLLIVRYGK